MSSKTDRCACEVALELLGLVDEDVVPLDRRGQEHTFPARLEAAYQVPSLRRGPYEGPDGVGTRPCGVPGGVDVVRVRRLPYEGERGEASHSSYRGVALDGDLGTLH